MKKVIIFEVGRKAREIVRKIGREHVECFADNSPENLRPIMGIPVISVSRGVLEICDIACGHGALLQRLKEAGFRVRGVDGAPVRVGEVQQSGIECICADVEHVPLPDGSLDVIICTECLEHVKDPVAVVKEVNRLLMCGGMVFVTTPYGGFCDCDAHLRHFYENNLCALFLQNGFEIENVLRIPYLNNSINDNLFVAAIKK